VLSGGGDCPGINAVVRAVCKTLMHDYGVECVGFLDGFRGMVLGESRPLGWDDVSGILVEGGTILGASSRDNPFDFAEENRGARTRRDRSRDVVRNFKKLGLDALVTIGGEGTHWIAARLAREHAIPMVGVPKTIDNDVRGTDLTFGFHTAVATAADAVEKLRTTAQSHHRVMVVEVMGRHAGWLALFVGVAGGAEVILVPEMPYRLADVCAVIAKRQRGRAYTIVVVSEGAFPEGGQAVVRRNARIVGAPDRLGGIGELLAYQLEERIGVESRGLDLGHIQRGGSPIPFDRILATRFGHAAAHAVGEGRSGVMVALRGERIVEIPLARAGSGARPVPLDHELLHASRCVGTSFGRADFDRDGRLARR
jgi:6-phosphofructokinase 1